MRDIVKTALFISLPYSFVVGLLWYFVTLELIGVRPGVPQSLYAGLDAVRFLIEANGLVTYLYELLSKYVLFAAPIFIALVLQGYIYNGRKNA
ncbi:MAG: hypothetical protein IPG64_25460 [Haliea sp.]|nr:hypothetical protein [Haliea sp.]MBK6740952.1 hypothetical protein [Haliea sp.]